MIPRPWSRRSSPIPRFPTGFIQQPAKLHRSFIAAFTLHHRARVKRGGSIGRIRSGPKPNDGCGMKASLPNGASLGAVGAAALLALFSATAFAGGKTKIDFWYGNSGDIS